MDQVGFNLPAEMLEVYKIRTIDRLRQGIPTTDVPCELLIALIERAQVLLRIESDERLFAQEKEGV